MHAEKWTRPYLTGGWTYVDRGRDFVRRRVDCWGFFMAVMEREFGVKVPSYLDDYDTAEAADPAFVSETNREVSGFRPIAPANARPGDAVLLHTPAGLHVGVVCGPGCLIHLGRHGVSILRMRAARIEGVYRYAA